MKVSFKMVLLIFASGGISYGATQIIAGAHVTRGAARRVDIADTGKPFTKFGFRICDFRPEGVPTDVIARSPFRDRAGLRDFLRLHVTVRPGTS